MSISESNVIDSVIDDGGSKDSVLLITDHLSWDNAQEHMLLLQEKINTYINFIESKQIYKEFPDTKGKELNILVVGVYELTPEAEKFYESIRLFLRENLGIKITFVNQRT